MNFDVSEFRIDKSFGTISRIESRFPVVLEELEIALHRGSHRQRPFLPSRGVSAENHSLASLFLRLPEAQDRDSVRIGEIIRGSDGLHLICLLTYVVTGHPFAGSRLRLAIAEVQTGLESPIVGLRVRFEPSARGPRFQ